MQRILPFVALVLALAVTPPLEAQFEGVVFSAYYECDPNLEAALDAVVLDQIAPIYDAQVAAGSITAWGWSAHVLGSTWRRLAFFIAADRAAGLAARGQIFQAAQSEAGAAVDMINRVCPRHEDYIWNIAQSSQVADPDATATASLSTYYSCNQGTEARADEIVAEVVAPVLEDLVRSGDLTGWSWLVHDSGGWFRRASVYAGDSATSIFAARDQLLELLGERDELTEFLTICSSHLDYNWNALNN